MVFAVWVVIFNASLHLFLVYYKYIELYGISSKHKLWYKLDKIIDRGKEKMYESIAKIILTGLFKSENKKKWKPPEELYNTITSYNMLMEDLNMIKRVLGEVHSKMKFIKNYRFPASIFSSIIALIILCISRGGAIGLITLEDFLWTTFLLVLLTFIFVNPSPSYRDECKNVLNILKKFEYEVIKEDINDESVKYDLLINILLERRGSSNEFKAKHTH